MSDQLRLERHVPGLLEDLYLGGTPDYRNEVLAATAATRQRPAWTFPERWLPMVDIATRLPVAPRVPVRTLLIIALLVALAAGAILYAGTSQRRLPAPFGPASNGQIVFAVDGDLFLGDAGTGRSRALTSGAGIDGKPMVAPDGTSVAFLRGASETGTTFELAVIGIDGGEARVLASGIAEPDRFVWAPDGTYILHNVDVDGRVMRYDVAGGGPVQIAPVALLQSDAFRPPVGDLVLYEGPGTGRTLWVMNPDGTGARQIYEIPAAELRDGCDFGAVRWSPDGTRIAILRAPADGSVGCRVFVMNADGTDASQLTVSPGIWTETDLRWSPDGTQIAFDRWELVSPTWQVRPLGVVLATGGAVRSVGPTPVSDGAAFEWSPDGTTILSLGGNVIGVEQSANGAARPVLIDVATGGFREAPWSASSWPAWQRLAP